MHIILCVDQRLGLSFGGKRLSRDREQIERMFELIGDRKLYVLPYSKNLFGENDGRVSVCDDPSSLGNGEYLFIETEDITGFADKIEDVILYRWNRTYPFDTSFDEDLLVSRILTGSLDFVGSSHDKITEEVYRK